MKKKNFPASQRDAAERTDRGFHAQNQTKPSLWTQLRLGRAEPAPVPAPHSPLRALESSTSSWEHLARGSQHSSSSCSRDGTLCLRFLPVFISRVVSQQPAVGWVSRLSGAGPGPPGGSVPRSELSPSLGRSSRSCCAAVLM